jgi:hypothetical protein
LQTFQVSREDQTVVGMPLIDFLKELTSTSQARTETRTVIRRRERIVLVCWMLLSQVSRTQSREMKRSYPFFLICSLSRSKSRSLAGCNLHSINQQCKLATSIINLLCQHAWKYVAPPFRAVRLESLMMYEHIILMMYRYMMQRERVRPQADWLIWSFSRCTDCSKI